MLHNMRGPGLLLGFAFLFSATACCVCINSPSQGAAGPSVAPSVLSSPDSAPQLPCIENAIRSADRRTGSVSDEELLDSARAAGHYLRRSIQPDGRFTYSWSADEGRPLPGYNILRHAGTIYALLELHEITREPLFLDGAQKALPWLTGSVRQWNVGSETAVVVVEGDTVKLGGNALAVLALAKEIELTGDDTNVDLMLDLADSIRQAQRTDGSFVHKQSFPYGEVSDFISEFYPGEAIFALVRAYSIDGNSVWLDVAEKGVDHLLENRRRAPGRSAHDHWLLYALNELDRHRPNPSWRADILEMTRGIIESQNRDPEIPEWFGGYGSPPRVATTAARTEGLAAAWNLLTRTGGGPEADAILQAIESAVPAMRRLQITSEAAACLPQGEWAEGGFVGSAEDLEIRIDYNQHVISALLALIEIRREVRAREIRN